MIPTFDIVIPTCGRESLGALLDSLRDDCRRKGIRVYVVDDRRAKYSPLPVPGWTTYVEGEGRGPAHARNLGWRSATAEWIVFLDDDVVPRADWMDLLEDDLRSAPPDVAGIQGRIEVPRPRHRRPTDHERNIAGLATARWATADMAYRRDVLGALDGFDERFPRPYREDADIALRAIAAGYRMSAGRRLVVHPIAGASPWVSIAKQVGNRDDALMAAKHGPDWRERAGVPRGRRPVHMATVAAAGAAAAGHVLGIRALRSMGLAAWMGLTGDFFVTRALPGPRTAVEIGTLLVTSIAIPFAATWHYLRGAMDTEVRREPRAVLLDRDGTLVADVPYNRDPDRVVPMPTARRALDRLRAAGIPIAVVSNQSGIARGHLSLDELAAVNRRVEELLGPLGKWFICTHGPEDSCNCRKPAPGLIRDAARSLGMPTHQCFYIGDIGSDVAAALAAGARPILVPTTATRADEIAAAPLVASTLDAAVDVVLKDSNV